METYRFRDSILELYNIAGKTNILSFSFGIFLLIFCCIREFDVVFGGSGYTSIKVFSEYSPAFWWVTYCSFLYALIVPLIRVRKLPYGRRIANFGWTSLGFFLAGLVVLTVSRVKLDSSVSQNLQGVAAVIATILVITGWFVQHQMAANTNRVNHTLNLLLQTRISEVFQTHLTNVNKVYPKRAGSVIPMKDVEAWHTNSEISEDKNSAISSQCYLLNYYEFLAVGIKSGLLDEELLYETHGGIIMGQLDRAVHVINKAQQRSRKSYVEFVSLMERWKPRRDFDSRPADRNE